LPVAVNVRRTGNNVVNVFVLGFISVPHLDLATKGSGYHGLVDEDKLIVDVTPKIRAIGTDICAFRIVNKHHGETPFEVGSFPNFLLRLFFPIAPFPGAIHLCGQCALIYLSAGRQSLLIVQRESRRWRASLIS
jgi:hypothetical protein